MNQRDAIRAPVRSALFVPAVRPGAISKVAGCGADMLILDLEDAVGPGEKDAGRAAVADALSGWADCGAIRAVRINAVGAAGLAEDAAASAGADAIVLPKIETPEDLRRAREPIAPGIALWAMIETPMALLNLAAIAASAQAAGLTGLIAGTNDLAKSLGCRGRTALVPHLAAIVAAARAYDLQALDGVFNAYRDAEGFSAEAEAGRDLGFDGKSLIHPDQVAAANAAFAPSEAELDWARRVVAAFEDPANADKGAIPIDGAMTERLHLEQARALLARR